MAQIAVTSLIVPVKLLAAPTHTSRVRSVSKLSRSSNSNSNESVLNGSQRILKSRSRASNTQGQTFASWSICVSMISSPARNNRPIDRDKCSVIVVMFWPKIISSADGALRKSAIASRADCTTTSASDDDAKKAPRFEFFVNRQSVIASATQTGTCVPPGLSK